MTDENEISLIREIEHLKQQQLSQEEEIFRLRAENEKLRQEQHSGGHLSMDMLDSEDNHEVLFKEIEKLKLDRRARDQEISKLRETNKQMNQQILLHQQDPQVYYLTTVQVLMNSLNSITIKIFKNTI